ncbi:MAG: DNA replication/repair protein RecF [Anaerolineae bacterium]
MHLSHLALTHFRNYAQEEISPSPGANILLGNNAQGKSNLLEALVCLSTTRSFRTSSERNLINRAYIDEPIPYARLSAHVEDGPVRSIELVITIDREGSNGGVRRHLRLDGVPHRLTDALGSLPSVLFTPDDIALVAGPPADRRRYLDVLLCQADRRYCRALALYNRALVQRNHLLRLIRSRHTDPEQLPYWDQLLAENGAIIAGTRRRALAAIAHTAAGIHASLAAGQGLDIGYAPGSEAGDEEAALLLQYTAGRRTDVERGVTTQGPHRDDVTVRLEGLDVAGFGSRGQMRTIALTLRLAEAAYLAQALGMRPLLLFDDVMSELDADRRRALEAAMADTPQSFVTDLDERPFSPGFLARAHLFRVSGGNITLIRDEAEGAFPEYPLDEDTAAGSEPPF